jgi:hypothetical protein
MFIQKKKDTHGFGLPCQPLNNHATNMFAVCHDAFEGNTALLDHI